MNYFKFFILSCLILFPFTSTSYGLTNSWCSNGKYSKDISPFPKPSFGNCPKTAKKIMSRKEVEEYYINGLGQEHLCTLIKSGYLYKLKDRKDYKAIIELIKGKDTKCDQFFKTKLAEKNSWCSHGKYSKAISPFPKPQFNKCPAYAKKIMTTKEVENYYLNGLGKDYLCKVTKHPLFFSSNHKREDYQALKQLFKPNQVNVGLMCAQLNKTKLAEKKAEEEKKLLTKEKTKVEKKDKIRPPVEKLSKDKVTKEKRKILSEKKAEEARIRALAEKLAKEEIARQLKVKQKEEKEAKQKALAQKKEKEEARKKVLAQKKAKEEAARKKALAKKKAEKLAKQKAIAAKKVKEDKARKKAIAKKKAEELAKQKALATKKVKEDELKQKVLNEKRQKLKDEAKYVVATLKEYVKTDANKLDILEVSELLENYNSEMQKGWSDSTVEKYEELYEYVQKDEGFIEFSAEKKSKQLAAYNEEITQLREYLTTSQSDLKAFITNNLGSNNAKKALKLAKETKSLLKDFDVNQAMTLKNDIATWKSMNGVTENKKYAFKILNKKITKKKQSVIKKVTQNKLANSTKKKNLKPAPLSVPRGKFEAATFCWGLLTMIVDDNFIKKMPALAKKIKFDSMRHQRATGILSTRGITGQNMMIDGFQVVIDIAGKTIEETDIKRGSSLHSLMIQCSSLDTLKSGIKKSNKTSSVTTISKKNSKPNDKNFKLKQGYFYKKRYADGSCTNRGKEICLSRDQFKNICQKVRGMTVFGRKTAALSASPRAYQLWLESGGYNTDPKTTYSNNVCRVNYYVSGVYKGSNRRDLVSAKAYEFVVDKKGTILIHKMSQY